MNRPSLSSRNSWGNFEKCILEVFILALKRLRDNENNLPIYEDDVQGDNSLNRQLNICLRHAIKEWEHINGADIPTVPNPNVTKQPDLDNENLISAFERAKPDFQWGFRDRLAAQNSLNSDFKNYDIECKRLGVTSNSRNLFKEYISKGVVRFTIDTHRYGQFTSSGLMIGYIQDTEFQRILAQVNGVARSTSLPEILLSTEGWKEDVSRLEHRLDRVDVEPTPFDLRHLWVNLRHHYPQQNTSTPKNKTPKREKKTKPKDLPKPIS
jgi:hypothetical protein